MVIPFPCRQCGKCCTMLERKEYEGISLFAWEKHLFPNEDINPSLGIGEDPESKNFKILLYTYNSSGCVHLEKNNCRIHDQRPMVCRSYPFRIRGEGKKRVYVVAPECTEIKAWPEKISIETRYQEMDAAELICDHLSRFYKASENRWRYYPEKGWHKIGSIKISE
jgi:Fe-S-cluster containining protein